MLELLKQANQNYSIAFTSIKPFHSTWRLAAPSHAYILKRINTEPHKFSELAHIINEYHSHGLKTLVPILPTRNGQFYMEVADCFYSLSLWYEGEKPSFRDPQHLQLVAQCFGKIHAFSQSTTFPPEMLNSIGLTEYQTNQIFLESLLPNLREQKNLNRVDRAILNWSEYYLQQGRWATSGLKNLKDFWPLLNHQKGFCHNDPAPGNIIIRAGNCYLIDFEYSNCDLFIKEFALLALRALQANQWDSKTLEILIIAYNRERPLTALELKMLPFLLCFPRRFWRLCCQRYQERLTWTEKRFQSRLWEITSEEKKRRHFLETNWPQLQIYEPRLGGSE